MFWNAYFGMYRSLHVIVYVTFAAVCLRLQ